MNILQYDPIITQINKTKTWIDWNKKVLYSRELKLKEFVSLGKRYNVNTNNYEYFIIFTNEKPDDRPSEKTKVDVWNRFKIYVGYIPNLHSYFDERYENIAIELVFEDNEGIVYRIVDF